MNPQDTDLLFALLKCHSTPGDETEMTARLTDEFSRAGLTVRQHGRYALSAWPRGLDSSKPVVLVCAHMDSPGYSVECIQPQALKLISLGHAQFGRDSAAAILKTRAGTRQCTITRQHNENHDEDEFYVPFDADADFGDRLCFAADPVVHGDIVISPFLDNRIGCYALCRLARERLELPVNLVFGATACEEIGGFGAAVLARQVHPDLVFCLDATYEAPEQQVLVGGGPVLTLSDASVNISCCVRDELKRAAADCGVRLQTEVYNYSGTDARAFPHQGLTAPVFALLLASRGNHSPSEEASLTDAEDLLHLLQHLLQNFSSYSF